MPTTTSTSHASAAVCAARNASAGSASPNHTTPGRSIAPHAAQRGGSSGNGAVRSSRSRPQPVQRTRQSEPCSSTTPREPAPWCSPSTFCVTSVKLGKRSCHAASTSCAGLGRTRATFVRRWS